MLRQKLASPNGWEAAAKGLCSAVFLFLHRFRTCTLFSASLQIDCRQLLNSGNDAARLQCDAHVEVKLTLTFVNRLPRYLYWAQKLEAREMVAQAGRSRLASSSALVPMSPVSGDTAVSTSKAATMSAFQHHDIN